MRTRHVRNQDEVWLDARAIAFSERWKTERTVVRARKVMKTVLTFFLLQFRLRDKGAIRLTLDKTLCRETRPDHNTGNSVPYDGTCYIQTSFQYTAADYFNRFLSRDPSLCLNLVSVSQRTKPALFSCGRFSRG